MRVYSAFGVLVTCVSILGCSKGTAPLSTSAPEAASATEAASTLSPRPEGPVNVVWILLDACRADHLSTYGYPRPTSPNIDALAARGVLFERNYAQAPNTLLSVGSYMTGRHNPVFYQDARHLGIWFLHEPPAKEKLLPTILKENGYATAMFSASPWYSAESRLGKSFDEFRLLNYGHELPEGPFNERNTHLFDWIEKHAQEKFFVYIHSLDTHEPRYHNNTKTTWLDPTFPRDRDGDLRRWKNGTFSAADQKHIVDLYDGGVAYADSSVGDIVAALERLGIADKTLVIVSSDHGEILGQDGQTVGHPQNAYEDDVLHTPLIIAGPGVPAGKRISARTENTDIVPSVVDLLGLKTEAAFDGISLRPTMHATNPPAIHEYTFARTAPFLIDADLDRIVTFDDVKLNIATYDKDALNFLNLPPRAPVIAYALPDAAGHRHEITPDPSLVARATKLDAEVLKPSWDAYRALPKETPPYFETGPGGSLDPKAVVPTFDPADNLWTRQRSRYLFRITENELLVADPSTEKPPQLILGVNIPNGEYRVQAYTMSYPEDTQSRGVSFKFKKFKNPGDTSPEEKDYREFGLPAPASGETVDGWLDVGTYTVTTGNFVYCLDTGKREDFTVLAALRFTQVGADVKMPDEEALRQEQELLETTGYGPSKKTQ